MADEQTTTTNDNPAQESVLGSQGSDNQSTDWRSSLSEELRADATLSNIKDLDSAAKTLIHQQKMLGSRIPLPKTDEERSELYTKLGRPESGDKYEINIPDTHKNYFNDEQVKEFRNVAHKIGLNSQQVKDLIDFQLKSVDYETQRKNTQITVDKQNTEDSLKKEWGYDYDKQVRNAQRALNVYGDPELQELMNGEAGNIPSVIKFFAKIGADVTEDMAKNTQNNTLAVSPLDAKAEIESIQQNKSHPYHNGHDKDHQNAVEHMRQLHEKVFGK